LSNGRLWWTGHVDEVGEIKMCRILFEGTVGKLSSGRMTGRWMGTVKMDYKRMHLCCVKWIELMQDQI
jgi:hypothetical protein